MKKVVCIDDAGAEGITVNKIYEGFEEGIILRIVNDFGEKAWYVVDRFKEAPVKIKLLLEDKYEVIENDVIYKIVYNKYQDNWYLSVKKQNTEECLFEIRLKNINDTLKTVLNALNIEVVEPLYKIDVEGEYTAEQVAELEKIGIKFKKECV